MHGDARSNELPVRGVFPSRNDFRPWLARLDSNWHHPQAFLGFLKHLPEWLSLQQAAIVSVASAVPIAHRGSRIGGRLIRGRVGDRSPGRSGRCVHRFV